MVVKRNWYVTASIALLSASAFIAAGVCAMWLWWVLVPGEQVYVPINVDKHHAEMTEDGLMLYRQFRVTRRSDVTITRELVRKLPDGTLFKLAMPSSIATYEPGEYNIMRTVPLPTDLKPGVYEIHNTARWRANPIREAEVMLPILTVEVK